jgi:hypothetical protein
LTVRAVRDAAVGFYVERLVAPLGVVIVQNVMGTDDDARGTAGTKTGRDDLGVQLCPLRLLWWHEVPL